MIQAAVLIPRFRLRFSGTFAKVFPEQLRLMTIQPLTVILSAVPSGIHEKIVSKKEFNYITNYFLKTRESN